MSKSNSSTRNMEISEFYCYLGKLHLLLDNPYLSLKYYIKVIETSNHSWILESCLKSLEMLKKSKKELRGYDSIYRTLLLGLQGKFHLNINKEIKQDIVLVNKPVVIVAGGTDKSVEASISDYEQLLINAFKDFQGTIISGGTTSGISGLVGRVQESNTELSTIGYLPSLIGSDSHPDEHYKSMKFSSGDGFSPLEPLKYWMDLLHSDINPSDVKLLGINGGRISAVEYRLALALGATVGIVKDSGREADEIVKDPDWMDSPNLIVLPRDVTIIKAFIDEK